MTRQRPGCCGGFWEEAAPGRGTEGGQSRVWTGVAEPTWTGLLTPLCPQIDRYAQRDLKKGLHLYGTPGNVGLTNAWSIIQTDVSGGPGGPGEPLPRTVPARASPAVPLLWRRQLHRLVRGLQRHARTRLLLPGVQRELWAARARHVVEGGEPAPRPPPAPGPGGPAPVTPIPSAALLPDGEDVAAGEPPGRGRLWTVHGAGAGAE